MGIRKKKVKEMHSVSADKGDTEITNEFVNIFMEEFSKQEPSPLEPFEWYVHRLRSKLCQDPEVFRIRFFHGYHALLSELGRSSSQFSKHK